MEQSLWKQRFTLFAGKGVVECQVVDMELSHAGAPICASWMSVSGLNMVAQPQRASRVGQMRWLRFAKRHCATRSRGEGLSCLRR